MKSLLYRIVIESDTKAGRFFDLLIQFLIVLSLVSFSIETLPRLSNNFKNILNNFELFCVVIFSLGYTSQSHPRNTYSASLGLLIFSQSSLSISLLVLTYGLSEYLGLRLFRIFKLFKYNSAINRFGTAFRTVQKELLVFMVGTIFMLYVSAVGIYYFENPVQPDRFKSVFHSMWWAVTSLTTVGYGDMYPITAGGKLFTTIVLFIGMGMVAIPTGLLASAFSQTFKN